MVRVGAIWVAAIVCILARCGGGEDESTLPEDVVVGFYSDWNGGDPEAACARVSEDGQLALADQSR